MSFGVITKYLLVTTRSFSVVLFPSNRNYLSTDHPHVYQSRMGYVISKWTAVSAAPTTLKSLLSTPTRAIVLITGDVILSANVARHTLQSRTTRRSPLLFACALEGPTSVWAVFRAVNHSGA